MNEQDTQRAVGILNRIMELELAGVVRYTHYALMIYGYNQDSDRVSWLKGNADESLAHAHKAGELVTLLGGHPSLKIGTLLETENTISAIFCGRAWSMRRPPSPPYYELLKLAEGSPSCWRNARGR